MWYAERLELSWEDPPITISTAEYGTSLAISVVRTLRGSAESVDGVVPLRLKRALIVAARAFDVFAAPTSMETKNLVSKRAGAGCRFGVLQWGAPNNADKFQPNYRHCSGHRRCWEQGCYIVYSSNPVVPSAKRLHGRYSGQPALLDRDYRGITCCINAVGL